MKKISFMSTVVFMLLVAQSSLNAMGMFRTGDYGVVAHKGNVAVDSARVYASPKKWTTTYFDCGTQKIYVGDPVVKKVNYWRSKGYKISVFKVIKGKGDKTLCWIK